MRLVKIFDLKTTEPSAYRELVLERLRLVPKGRWKLAGGAKPFHRPYLGSPHLAVGIGGLHHWLISATLPASVGYKVKSGWKKPNVIPLCGVCV
jgi:hypothetical protein